MLRPLVLPALIGVSLASVYFLPTAGKLAESAVDMQLPDRKGAWQLRKIPPSEAELGTLAKDTEFAKAECYTARPGEYDENGNPLPDVVSVSVVLSGVDINNSIHRPERCMPAQGHQILESSDRTLAIQGGHSVTVKRLKSLQRIASKNETESLELNCLTYYFFVGHDQITNEHVTRTLIDMKDRLVKGMDQRWAYVSFSMWYGDLPWLKKNVTEQEAEEKLAAFVSTFGETQVNWKQIKP